MGFFDKAKEKAREAAAAAQQGLQQPIDPAIFGGPSNRPVAADDPIWAPINGFSLEDTPPWRVPPRRAASPTRRA